MFGGIFGTVLRSFGVGLTLGGILVAAAPKASFGITIAFIGMSVFLAATLWPLIENLIRIATGFAGDRCASIISAVREMPLPLKIGSAKSE